MAALAERIEVACRKTGRSLKHVAESAGISESTLRRWRTPGDYHAPRVDLLAALAGAVDMSLAELLTGVTKAELRRPGTVPVYRTGGGNHWIVSEQYEPYEIELPAAKLEGYQVDGDSMEPLARHGQIVLAHKDEEPRSGDLAVIEFRDGTHTFKRVYIQGNIVKLASVNPNYEPEVYRRSEVRRMRKVWGVKF